MEQPPLDPPRPVRVPRLAYLLLVGLALAWTCRGLLAFELFWKRDQLLVFYPLKQVLAAQLSQLRFPEWWPWDALGQPLAALPIASLLHPTSVLYAVLPFQAAFVLQTLIPFPVGVAGAWSLGRTLGLGRAGSALAAAGFGLSFYFVGLAEQTQMFLAAMTMPWVWREALRVYRGSRASLLGLALSIANLCLGGDPMLLELVLLTLLGFLLGVRWRPRGVVRVLGGIGAGLLVAAVQLVPMAAFFPESPRSAGLGIDVTDLWAWRWPQVRGALLPGSFEGGAFLFDSSYLGVAVLVLAVVGLRARWRWRWPLLAVVLFGGLLAFGRATPAWELLAAVVPGWRGFQFPAKVVAPAVLALSLLAGRGLRVLSRSRGERLALGAAVALLGLAAAGGSWSVAGVALVAAGLAATGWKVARARPVLSFAWPALLVADLLLHGSRIETVPFSRVEGEPPAVAALRQAGVGAEGASYMWVGSGGGTRGLDADWTTVRPLLNAPFSLPTTAVYLQGFTRRFYDVAMADKAGWLRRGAGIFGANTFVVDPAALRPEQASSVVYRDDAAQVAVLKTHRVLPRAYLATGVRRLPADQVARALYSQDFKPGAEVLVEDVAGEGPAAAPSLGGAVPVSFHRVADGFEVDCEAAAPSVLVVNETFTAGFSATDQGQPAALFPANHAVLGVAISPGPHHLRFTYRTPGLRAGAALSALGCVLLVVLELWRRRARPRLSV